MHNLENFGSKHRIKIGLVANLEFATFGGLIAFKTKNYMGVWVKKVSFFVSTFAIILYIRFPFVQSILNPLL